MNDEAKETAPGGLAPPPACAEAASAGRERKIEAAPQAQSGNLCSQRDKPAGEPPSPAGLPGRDARLPPLPRPAPLYSARNIHPAYSLRYDWTGWPTDGTALPPAAVAVARHNAPAWEPDGLRLLEAHATPEKVQLLFSATPQVSPVFCCQRAKGRLQHALRRAGTPVNFSRKVSFRTLGENTTAAVEGYLRKQVGKERFADPRFETIMRQFTVTCPDVALAEPSASASGRYWYNLHLVLVMAGRFRVTNPERLACVRDAAFGLAEKHGCRIAALSVMPDHVHMALCGNIEQSPEDIALAFQNGLARAAGCRAWQDEYYVGTFSEYDLDVIRRAAGQAPTFPAGSNAPSHPLRAALQKSHTLDPVRIIEGKA